MRDPMAESENSGTKSLSARLDDIDGKTVGFHINTKEAAEPVASIVEEKLLEAYPNISVSHCTVPARSEEGLAEIREWAAEVDGCVATIGDCGGCTRAVVRAANAIEEAETPAVGLVADGFEVSWETNAADQRRYLRNQVLPIRSETTDLELLREKISPEILDGITDALTEPLTDEEKGLKEKNLLS